MKKLIFIFILFFPSSSLASPKFESPAINDALYGSKEDSGFSFDNNVKTDKLEVSFCNPKKGSLDTLINAYIGCQIDDFIQNTGLTPIAQTVTPAGLTYYRFEERKGYDLWYRSDCTLNVAVDSSGKIQSIKGHHQTNTLEGAIFGEGKNFCKRLLKGKY